MMGLTTPRSKKFRVLVVDDHPVVRYGYSQLIGREPDLEVCGEAAGVAEALQQAESQLPDAAIVDITLDGEDGIELIEYIQSRWPAMKILVASNHDEETFAGRVLRASGWNDTAADWTSAGEAGLDQGMSLLMIENFRSGFPWGRVRDIACIRTGLKRAGFDGGWLNP